MAKVLGFLVLMILLVLGIKLALTALSWMTTAFSVALLGCCAVGAFTVTRYALKSRK
jgi:hypothetical protein